LWFENLTIANEHWFVEDYCPDSTPIVRTLFCIRKIVRVSVCMHVFASPFVSVFMCLRLAYRLIVCSCAHVLVCACAHALGSVRTHVAATLWRRTLQLLPDLDDEEGIDTAGRYGRHASGWLAGEANPLLGGHSFDPEDDVDVSSLPFLFRSLRPPQGKTSLGTNCLWRSTYPPPEPKPGPPPEPKPSPPP
jgi:hypothetical protein